MHTRDTEEGGVGAGHPRRYPGLPRVPVGLRGSCTAGESGPLRALTLLLACRAASGSFSVCSAHRHSSFGMSATMPVTYHEGKLRLSTCT